MGSQISNLEEEASTSVDPTEDKIQETSIQNCTVSMNSGDVFRTVITNSSLTKINSSVEQIKEVQLKYETENFLLDVDKTSYNYIAHIFPKMVEVNFFDEDTFITKEAYMPSMVSKYFSETKQSTKEFRFRDVLERFKGKQCKSLNLIGLPGQGKSTFCKRVVKSFHNDMNSLCILIKCMNLNFDPFDEKLTLQELLIDNNYPDLNQEECRSAFEWILENEENLLLIFDGCEDANWSIKQSAPLYHYSKPQRVCDLVSNVVHKKYLPRSHVILTCRPHAMKSLPISLRQNFTIQLLDLSFDDMKSLFVAFAGTKGNELWHTLHSKAPQLINLCGNPLLLQFVITVCVDPRSNVATITTMTRLFSAVFDLLNASDHSNYIDIRKILHLLTKLAYNVTVNLTVLITVKDISAVGLDVSLIRHLIVCQQHGGFCHLFEGKERFHFIHQILQEYLAALYIAKYMPWDEFEELVDAALFSSHWTVVKKFLFGIIFDLCKEDSEDKRRNTLKEKVEQFISTNKSGRDLVEIHTALRECVDDKDIAEMVACQFPTKAMFDGIHVSNSDAHAVSLVLRNVERKLEHFSLRGCRLNSQAFRFFIEAIKWMAGSIDILDISFNLLCADLVDEICDILSKINVKLWMAQCFDNGSGVPRSASKEEKEKIQAKVNSIGNSDLKVFFDHGDYIAYVPV